MKTFSRVFDIVRLYIVQEDPLAVWGSVLYIPVSHNNARITRDPRIFQNISQTCTCLGIAVLVTHISNLISHRIRIPRQTAIHPGIPWNSEGSLGSALPRVYDPDTSTVPTVEEDNGNPPQAAKPPWSMQQYPSSFAVLDGCSSAIIAEPTLVRAISVTRVRSRGLVLRELTVFYAQARLQASRVLKTITTSKGFCMDVVPFYETSVV
jgi:hypothetical protein